MESLDFNEQLSLYYKNTFPYQLIYNWLNYKDGGKNCFKYREFSFTLPGDIYVRYLSFEDSLEFRSSLLAKIPIKIDIGAVYNINPRLSRSYPNDFIPQQRELVFDIDISDYDDVRNCCKETNICPKCWPLMKIGAKILHSILTREFGFKHLLFVFSGRRGFHCWVCDKQARELGSEARKALADYFTVVTGGQSMVKRVTLNPLQGIHPMLVKALEIIDQEFDDLMINKQDFLSNDHLVQSVIDLCVDNPQLHARLIENCKITRLSSADCWKRMEMLSNSNKKKANRANYFIQEVKLQHCFPRLDANVTKGFNHLLKLPFCIHPKTGNVCVPMDIEEIDSFDILKVPNLKNLTRESMDPYVKLMKRFVDNLNN